MQEYQTLSHMFGPLFDGDSRILVLGTFPSVKSRETQFYYGNPQNRFWKVTAALTGEEEPETVPDKKAFLLRNRIALWDVIAECDIAGSSDSSIRNVKANDLRVILDHAPIGTICANGAKAYDLYMKYCYPTVEREIIKLPSTSPANAAWNVERLTEDWGRNIQWKG